MAWNERMESGLYCDEDAMILLREGNWLGFKWKGEQKEEGSRSRWWLRRVWWLRWWWSLWWLDGTKGILLIEMRFREIQKNLFFHRDDDDAHQETSCFIRTRVGWMLMMTFGWVLSLSPVAAACFNIKSYHESVSHSLDLNRFGLIRIRARPSSCHINRPIHSPPSSITPETTSSCFPHSSSSSSFGGESFNVILRLNSSS